LVGHKIAKHGETSGKIMDGNGNSIGKWEILDTEAPSLNRFKWPE